MQRSLILQVATRYLMPLMFVFSIFLLLRGHNEAGGGFVGGLVASSALMLYAISSSPSALWKLLPLDPRFIAGIGLLLSLLSGIIPIVNGLPFMTGMWIENPLPVVGKIGTPTLFDVGVYFLVIGVVVWILLEFAEDE
jgi:multicomponent Na+:H+ antiporter subunit B